MKIIQIPKKGNASLVGIMCPVGSRNETPKIKGISHYIEHACFKRTKNRTAYEISKSIEQYGGQFNAFTDWELTCYWAKISNKYLKKAINVIEDLVTNPIFPTKDVKNEKKVIIQELKMYEDNPHMHVYDLFNEIYFTKQSNFHVSIIGTEKSLQQIHREEILKFYNEHYNNLTMIIIGDIIEKSKSIYTSDIRLESTELQHANKNMNTYFQERNTIRQSNILLGNYLNSINGTIKDIYSLDLIENIYNDMSGRLFTKLREQNHLCYSVYFDYGVHSDGLINWTAYIALEKNKINKAKEMIIKELNRPFTKQEIKSAIQKSLGKEDLRLDDLNYIFNTVANSEMKAIDYKEFLYNATKNTKEAGKTLNEFRKKMNFKKNLLVGIIPE